MRKFFTLLLLAACVCAYAQEVVPFALTKQNARAMYRCVYGKKKKIINFGVSYYNIAVNSVTTNADGTKTIVYRTDFLNEKKQISSYSDNIGSEGGFFNQIVLAPDGSFAMDQDMEYGFGNEMARSGYMFKVPGKLSVGQTLEGSTVNQKYVTYAMGKHNGTSSLAYNNIKVDREEDYETLAGTFHCYVLTYDISGTMSANSQSANLNESVTMWVAPGIGIVCYRYYTVALGKPFPVYIELCELEGN